MRTRSLTLAGAMAIGLALAGCGPGTEDDEPGETVTASTEASDPTATPESEQGESEPSEPGGSVSPSVSGGGAPRVVGTVADGLAVPWGIGFLPDGKALVTERDSRRLLELTPRDGGQASVREVAVIEEAEPEGEGGLLGVAVSPSYAEDGWVFLYLSAADDNRVLRYSYADGQLSDPDVILDGIPKGFIHDGGRLAFGPDDLLYVSTGESGESELAQDPASLGGKILRVTMDGEPAPGNPDDDSPVWSLGHRNIQGLAWDDDDRLWASEFGDSDWDELNRIEPGRNYGWPLVEGEGDALGAENLVPPQVVWGTADASPSGLAHVDDRLWLGALRGQRLWRVDLDDGRAVRPKGFLVGDYGRLRSVVAAPDGMLWVTTSNHDGRGNPAPSDDRILLVDPRSDQR